MREGVNRLLGRWNALPGRLLDGLHISMALQALDMSLCRAEHPTLWHWSCMYAVTDLAHGVL